jgi:hypothetical protein
MKTFINNQAQLDSIISQYSRTLKELFGQDVQLVSHWQRPSPREQLLNKYFSIVPLWYLQFLIDDSPSRIVDIGCGANCFKPIIEKLHGIKCHGIDNNPGADEVGLFDSEFSQQHENKYESAFSINALHFIPLSALATRVNEFYNILAPGGYGFLALNSDRLVRHSPPDWLLQTFGSIIPTPMQTQQYVSAQLSTLSIDFIVNDLLITEHQSEPLDGNIRLVFQKKRTIITGPRRK